MKETTRQRKKKKPDGEGTFGEGLGVDFEPLGKRIKVSRPVDSKAVKIRRPPSRESSGKEN